MACNNYSLDYYPWLTKAYQDLASPLSVQRAHHALLIKYTEGCGENELIMQFVMRLLCLTHQDNKPCLHCHHCQLFLAENHPDCYVIEPEKNKQTIGVEQIRKITHKVYEKSQQGGNKVIWIKTASLMTESAANALLKTLEEPPPNTYLILSTTNNSQLLPTIYSRCQTYFLSTPELESAILWLKQNVEQQYNNNQLASALLLNSNAPIAALTLLNNEQWQKREQFYHDIYEHLLHKNLWLLRDSINQDDRLIRLYWFITLLNDGLKARQKSGRFIINRDHVPLVRLFSSLGDEKIIAIYLQWNKCYQQISNIAGLNHDLVISNLLAQSEMIISTDHKLVSK